MKLYYHKTSGGAEYYCLRPVADTNEGDVKTWLLRTDGELEINPWALAQNHIRLTMEN